LWIFLWQLSDFGLAKLMDREQSRVVTSMRGTPGYLAPEWLLPHAAVTAKTDVYSFGMVLLELVSGRENTNFSLGKEQWYFPAWAFKLMGEGRTMELLDKRLHVEEVEYFHKEDAVRAIHVALLCIQDDPAARPAMSRVVHMLQGHVEPEPLNARQAAIQPPRRLVTAFAASVCEADPLKSEKKIPENSNLVDSRKNSTDKNDSRKNSWSNDLLQPHDAILSELQSDHHLPKRNDMNLHRSSRLPVVSESPAPPRAPRHESLEDLEGDGFKLEPDLPPAVQEASKYRSSHKGDRLAGVHMMGSNPKCIPPWPVKGDVVLLRGPQGDFHGVVRDVRVQTKQMQLGLLHRVSSETRWSVREEETVWRHWNESIRTLDFWVVVRWATIPGRGFEKFPVEWQVK
jgi:serine/threonine protein kinase